MAAHANRIHPKRHRRHRFNWQIFVMAMAGVIFLAIFAYIICASAP